MALNLGRVAYFSATKGPTMVERLQTTLDARYLIGGALPITACFATEQLAVTLASSVAQPCYQ